MTVPDFGFRGLTWGSVAEDTLFLGGAMKMIYGINPQVYRFMSPYTNLINSPLGRFPCCSWS